MTKPTNIYASNLKAALATAIRAREEEERALGYEGCPSILLEGWQQVLEALRRGERVEIRYEET